MKQMEVTEKVIGDNTFYIRPFPAFTAANISGELAALLAPALGSVAPALSGRENVGDAELEEVLPAMSGAFSSISGDKFEALMKKLLITHRNVSVESEATDGKAVQLTYDLANEVFCGNVQDMYILCIEVIKVNYSGFFGKLTALFGNPAGTSEGISTLLNTAN